jgi:hypothetical protein
MVSRQHGSSPEEAVKDANRYLAEVKQVVIPPM